MMRCGVYHDTTRYVPPMGRASGRVCVADCSSRFTGRYHWVLVASIEMIFTMDLNQPIIPIRCHRKFRRQKTRLPKVSKLVN